MKGFLQQLRAALEPVTDARGLVVALSGGMDSMVLLHALARLAQQQSALPPLRALHVNHGLLKEANAWQDFCAQACAALQVPLQSLNVQVSTEGSTEAAAREARYGAFAESLKEGEVLLTAQHRDDQMETLLLRLMRGAGPAALAGMPVHRSLGRGQLYRPLLGMDRSTLAAYARASELQWIEDPSNQDTVIDRNFCRHEILPRLEQRWPAYRESWQKSQTLLKESGELLKELARDDLNAIGVDDGAGLRVERLLALSAPRQRNLLRYWLARLELPEPGWNRLQQLCEEVLQAATHSNAELTLADVSLKVDAGVLQALRRPGPPQTLTRQWNAVTCPQFVLPGNGELVARPAKGRGLGRLHADALQIRYRQGGESIRLPGRPTRALKKLLQESTLPAWLRERLPLLYEDDRLVFVPGFGPLTDCAAKPDEEGLEIHWQAPEFRVQSAGDRSQQAAPRVGGEKR